MMLSVILLIAQADTGTVPNGAWYACLGRNISQFDAPGEPASAVAEAVMTACPREEAQARQEAERKALALGLRPSDPDVVQIWNQHYQRSRGKVAAEILRVRAEEARKRR